MPIVLLLVAVLLSQVPAAPVDPLPVVRAHYATAAYEDALAVIAGLDPVSVTAELEQFRAMCLMALGRTDEGTRAVERLVHLAPLYVVDESAIAPRLARVFREIRQRVLPLVVRERFDRARLSLEAGQYDAATTQLRDLMQLLDALDATGEGAAFVDLRQLADGFIRLAAGEQALRARTATLEAAAAATPPPEPPSSDPPVVPATDAVVVERLVIYSADDGDVTAPIEISRFMPPWNPPPAMRRVAVTYRGDLEVVVDEAGRVEAARMLRPSHPAYDVDLLDAARDWRFEPARRRGAPVKYRLTFAIVLAAAP